MNDKSERAWLRLIGDVHGALGDYVKLTYGAEYTIQVGDLSTGDYAYINCLDHERHKVLGGNHDNYREDAEGRFCVQTPHFLGDYGVYEVPGFGPIFFVRGGFSIDKAVRIEGRDWFSREELSWEEMYACMDKYKEVKPEFVISHECPAFLLGEVGSKYVSLSPSRTARFLERLFEEHQPKRWVFGHHHRRWFGCFKGCLFDCVADISRPDCRIDFLKRK